MRISSYGRTASVMSTMQNREISKIEKTNFLTVMELQQMHLKSTDDSSKYSKKYTVNFDEIVSAILKSGDLNS